MERKDRNLLLAWLVVTYLLITLMVLVGGATRLTGSGLSMVDWGPWGSRPPSSSEDWNALFARYQESPEFQQVNHWMTLDDFRPLFWWEYGHRQLGRLIGLVFGLPRLWFWWVGALRTHRIQALAWLALFLGALQGGVGWWMVKSGLQREPHVSHYRLAVHLGLAFVTAMVVLWMFLEVRSGRRSDRRGNSRVYRGSWFFLGLLGLQIVWGAFMAGKRAGWRFDTWPLMAGQVVPEGAFATALSPFEDGTTVHWIHRHLGLVVVGVGFWLGRAVLQSAVGGTLGWAFGVGLAAQFTLGVLTIVYGVPIPLAMAHQVLALVLLSLTVTILHRSRPARGASAL